MKNPNLFFCLYFILSLFLPWNIYGDLTGTRTIKSSGGDYSTFTAAITDLNTQGVGPGGVIFYVDADLSFTESCPPISITTATATRQVVFQKNGDGANPVIKPTGGIGTSDAGIVISGGDYITFDGIDIMVESGSALEYGFYIKNSGSTNGAQFNTIKNSKITLDRTNTNSKGICQAAGGTTPTSLAGTNSNNKYYNITIENSFGGISLASGSSTYLDENCEIGSTSADNWSVIGGSSSDDIGGASAVYGIYLSRQNNFKIFNTEVRNLTSTANHCYGIYALYSMGNPSISNCKVHDLKINIATSNSYRVYAISAVNLTLTLTTNIFNNAIYSLNNGVSLSNNVYGIYTSSSSANANIYFNSVRILAESNLTSAPYYNNGSNVNVKNNIFANYSTPIGSAKAYCIYSSSSTVTSSNNVLYTPTSAYNFVGFSGGADRISLEQFAASTSGTAPTDGNEGGSCNYDPAFTSSTDLTLLISSPARNSGTPIPEITTDINGILRDVTRPNIGAYETSVTQVDKSAPVISNVSVISGINPEIFCTINDNSTSFTNAIVRLWYRLSSSSGAFTGLDADSKPSGSMNGVYAWDTSLFPLDAGKTYNFYIAARDGQGEGIGIWVNPIWTAEFPGFSVSDPPNYTSNPDVTANLRSFIKTNYIAAGTYDVGTGSTLEKLKDVANELNISTLQGNVIYEMTNNYDGTTGETFPIVFNQLFTSGGDWAVTIRVKSGAGGRVTSGDCNGNLIQLNGADRITFDGRESGAGSVKEWTISNISTDISSSTFNFINDASNNIIKYCTIKGSSTNANGGVLLFSTTTETSGNDNNSIEYNDITNASDLNRPYKTIYSLGTSGKENSGNVIKNNNIYNFFHRGINTVSSYYGIYLNTYNTDWEISGNSFYETSDFVSEYDNSNYFVICIRASAGNNFTISNNYIGGKNSLCEGNAWTKTGFNNTFAVISIAVGTSTPSNIQSNVIKNFSWTNSSLANFTAIEATGSVNIGTVTGNIIGQETGTNSIILINGGSGRGFRGINTVNGNVDVRNNKIGSITAGNSSSTNSTDFIGINKSGSGNFICRNNIIGSTTSANSINCSSNSTSNSQRIYGIYSSPGFCDITGNIIANLINSSSSSLFENNVLGIAISADITTPSTVSGNFIYNLSANDVASYSSLYGIKISSGAATLSNNIINIGGSPTATIYGIYESGAANNNYNIYYNTIYLSGSLGIDNIKKSYAFYSNANTNIRDFRNNIFYNARSTVDGQKLHYSLYFNYASNSNLTLGYNTYYATGVGGMLGYYNSSDVTMLPLITGMDANSLNTNPLFANAGGTTALDYKPAATLTGQSGLNILLDYLETTRSVNYPTMGAIEGLNPLPVELSSFSSIVSGCNVTLNWQTANEINNYGFDIERTIYNNKLMDDWRKIGFIEGHGSSNSTKSYSFVDKTTISGKYFYRLKQIDNDGRFFYSDSIEIKVENIPTEFKLAQNYPNPFNPSTTIKYSIPSPNMVTIKIFDVLGTEVTTLINEFKNAGFYEVNFDGSKLSSGTYFYRIKSGSFSETKKLLLLK